MFRILYLRCWDGSLNTCFRLCIQILLMPETDAVSDFASTLLDTLQRKKRKSSGTYPTYSNRWEARGLGAGGLHIAHTVLTRSVEVDGSRAVGGRKSTAVSWGRGLGETLRPVVVDHCNSNSHVHLSAPMIIRI